MLSVKDRERYLRQLSIEGFGEAAQKKLAAARVFIAGAGGLGCSVVTLLAAAGVGRLRICDMGRIEESNLNRQVLYTERDIGKPKVEIMAEWIRNFDTSIVVEPHFSEMTRESLPAMLAGCDLAIDALDNLPSRYDLNRATRECGIPLLHGAVEGFAGQAMVVFPDRGPCLMCLYRGVEGQHRVPVIGTAPALTGAVQAAEAIKLLTGIGKPPEGSLLMFDGLAMEFKILAIPRDPACPLCS
jgi:molybdopterin/thiamine biosynthesis adenylyltransferase